MDVVRLDVVCHQNRMGFFPDCYERCQVEVVTLGVPKSAEVNELA